MSSHDREQRAIGHIIPIRLLVITCIILLALTALTVWVAKLDFDMIQMGELTIIVAMGVAVIKCTVVVLIFMHLRWDRSFLGFVFLGAILFVALFIGLALLDTIEYQPSLIPGDTPAVQLKVDALNAAAAAGEHEPADH